MLLPDLGEESKAELGGRTCRTFLHMLCVFLTQMYSCNVPEDSLECFRFAFALLYPAQPFHYSARFHCREGFPFLSTVIKPNFGIVIPRKVVIQIEVVIKIKL